MNKFKNLLFVVFTVAAAAVVLNSCETDDGILPVLPTITFIGDTGYTTADVTVDAGTAITAGINSSDEDKIESFQFKVEYSATPGNPLVYDVNVGEKNFTFDTTLATATTVGTETWTFKVTNKDGEVATRSFVVTTQQAAGMINTYTAVVFGSQNSATKGSFYDVHSNTVHLQAAAGMNSADIDMVYYDGATNMSTLGSPDNADVATVFNVVSGWATRNSTRFMATTVTTADFDAATTDALFSMMSPMDEQATMLSDDDVVAFETTDGKKGMVKVVAIDAANDEITIVVKVQQ